MTSPSQKASPDPTTTEELEADLPGFGPGRTPTPPDPLDPKVSTVTDPATATAEGLPGDETPWDDSPEAGSQNGAKTSPKSGTGSSPGSIGDVLDPLAFREVIAMGLEGAGLVAHHRLGKGLVLDELGADGQPRRRPLWTFDEQDLDSIATPLSKIAARHMPIRPGPANDVADGIEAGMGAAGYVVKNLRRRAELARIWGQQTEQNAPAG